MTGRKGRSREKGGEGARRGEKEGEEEKGRGRMGERVRRESKEREGEGNGKGYGEERGERRRGEGAIFHPLVYSSNTLNSWDWAQPKGGATELAYPIG